MDDAGLDPVLKNAIVAYFEGWELVDYLEVPIDVVVELLEEYIIDNMEDISDRIGFERDVLESTEDNA